MQSVTAHIDETPRGFQYVWMKNGQPIKYSKSYGTEAEASAACQRSLAAQMRKG